MPREVLIEVRAGTAAEWAAADPVLNAGEPGWDTTNSWLKIGDGVTAWSALVSPSTLGGQLFFAVAATDFQMNAGLNHVGTTVGFYATTPIAKQTGVAVTAAGIHAALVALGLIGV